MLTSSVNNTGPTKRSLSIHGRVLTTFAGLAMCAFLLSACSGEESDQQAVSDLTVEELVEAGISQQSAEEIVQNEINDSGASASMTADELLETWESASTETTESIQPFRCEDLLETPPFEVVGLPQATCSFSFGGPANGLTGGSPCTGLRVWAESPHAYESISLRMDGVLAVWVARPEDREWSFQSWEGTEVDQWPDIDDFWYNTLEPACGDRSNEGQPSDNVELVAGVNLEPAQLPDDLLDRGVLSLSVDPFVDTIGNIEVSLSDVDSVQAASDEILYFANVSVRNLSSTETEPVRPHFSISCTAESVKDGLGAFWDSDRNIVATYQDGLSLGPGESQDLLLIEYSTNDAEFADETVGSVAACPQGASANFAVSQRRVDSQEIIRRPAELDFAAAVSRMEFCDYLVNSTNFFEALPGYSPESERFNGPCGFSNSQGDILSVSLTLTSDSWPYRSVEEINEFAVDLTNSREGGSVSIISVDDDVIVRDFGSSIDALVEVQGLLVGVSISPGPGSQTDAVAEVQRFSNFLLGRN